LRVLNHILACRAVAWAKAGSSAKISGETK
jgi:hypothetical protein